MNGNVQTLKHEKSFVREMVMTSLLIALVFISTAFINIRLPISVNGGLIHLGNTMLFAAAILFGKKKGAIAGAFGMGLFDIFTGWALWAPFTFIIRGVMGYMVGSIAHKKQSFWWNVLAMFIGGIWMIAGYYVSEVILYGNWITPLTSIPGDITQVVLGAILGMPIISILKGRKLV